MVVAEFKNDKFTSVYGLRQWDFGQELLIKGTGIQGKTVEVHFALERDNVALRILGTIENENITVCIPDILLQSGNSIYAYVYKSTDTEGKTTHEIFMHVSPRAKPEDYTEKEFKNALQQVLAIAQSVREEADAGKFNATDEQVKQVVDAYMEENPVAITVDKTLTQSGKAADAKVTGDKFLQYAIKNTVTGESPVAITDSAEEKLQDLKLLGKTEQTQDPPPSPNNPQEIKNVGKYNSDTGKYEIDVQVTGKNLFNISDLKAGKVREDGYIDSVYKNYKTIVLDIKSSGNYLIRFKKNADYDGIYITAKYFNGQFSTPYLNVFAEQNAYITLNKGINILSFKAKKNNNETTFTGDSNIMISYVKNIEYEPYREPQTVTLSLNQPLRGIGEYKDEVTKDGIVRRIKQITLNGSENWSLSNAVLVNTNKFYLPKVDDAYSAYRKISSLVDALPFVADENSDELGQRFYLGNPMINLDKEKFPNVDTLKKYLSENPMTVQYVIEKPIIEPLPEDFKQAIESLKTYYPTTVVTADGGEVDADIEVTYIADTKNYVDRKIKETVSAQMQNAENILSLMPESVQATMIEKDTNKILEREVTR